MSRTAREIWKDACLAVFKYDREKILDLKREKESVTVENRVGWGLLFDSLIYLMTSDSDSARDCLRKAMIDFRSSDDSYGLACALLESSRYIQTNDTTVWAEEAIQIFDSLGDDSALSEIHSSLSAFYLAMENIESAKEAGVSAARHLEDVSDPVAELRAHRARGQWLIDEGRIEESNDVINMSIDIASPLEMGYWMASAFMSLARNYYYLGDVPKVAEYSTRALAITTRFNDRFNSATNRMNLGIVYAMLGDIERSISEMMQALTIHEELGRSDAISSVLSNIGATYNYIGEYASALEYTNRAIDILSVDDEPWRKQKLLISRAGIIVHLGRCKEGLEQLDRIAESTIRDPDSRVEYHLFVGEAHLGLGDLVKSEEALVRAMKVSEDLSEQSIVHEVYRTLRNLAKAKGDLESYIVHNEKYQSLKDERMGTEATRRVAMMERESERAVLYSTLPKHVADRVARGETVNDHYESASVLFLDIVGFTAISDRIPAREVVELLEKVFEKCDKVCAQHGLTKVKTIGDSYLAISGVPEPLDDHAQRAAHAALGMMQALAEVGEIEVRIGLHSGPVVAGVIGKERLQYDIWGDTVNLASRMESTGESSRIQVSEVFLRSCAAQDDKGQTQDDQLAFRERGDIEIKGKGMVKTYWLSRET